MEIFRDDEDFRYFEHLLVRHISKNVVRDKFGREYKNYHDDVKLCSYCLMPNHFHLLLWQVNKGGVQGFMSSVCTSYGMYFNKKYKRKGPLFESAYKAVIIENDPQLMHITRYIHLNPMGYRMWDYSSYSDYVYSPREWVSPDSILSLFSSKQAYVAFVDDYEDVKRANDIHKAILEDE